MRTKKGRGFPLMFRMALAAASIAVLMLGCSSNGNANVAEDVSKQNFETFEDGLDYLNVDEKERARIDSLATTDVYMNYSEAFAKYQEAMKTMSFEEFQKTEEGKAYTKAMLDLLHVTRDMGLSVNASTAINWKASFDNPVKKK